MIWSWIESNGKRHDNMLVPQMEYMVELFKKHFQTVEIVEYANGFYWGILAGKKKRLFETIYSQLTSESLLLATQSNKTLTANLRPTQPSNFLKKFVRKLLRFPS